MKRGLYRILSALPSKVTNVAIGLASIVASAWPEQFRTWTAEMLTAPQIQLYGAATLAVCAAYWVVLISLRPPEEDANQPSSSTAGPNSPALSGTFRGPVTINTGSVYAPPPPQDPNDPLPGGGPGGGVHAAVKFERLELASERLIFAFGNPGSTRLACYLTPSEHFKMKVTDRRGTTYELEAGTDRRGVTYDHFLYLAAEVGLLDDSTALRVRVNGETVAFRSLPFRIDFGGEGWPDGVAMGSMKSDRYTGDDLSTPSMLIGEVVLAGAWHSRNQSSATMDHFRQKWAI